MSSYIEVVRRPKTPFEKVVSGIVSVLCAIVVAICAIVCIASLNCKMKGVINSVGGYSAVTIADTKSMENSGFFAGDVVLIRRVNVESLKGDQYNEDGELVARGDIIAFYRYSNASYDDSYCNKLSLFTADMASEEENVKLSIGEFFGEQNVTIQTAGRSRSSVVFHHIKEIRYDETTDKLFFKTYGTSNPGPDTKWISEDLVVGKYVENGSPIILGIFKAFATQAGIILIISIPLLVMMIFVVLDILRGLSLAAMESSVLNGKLSLSDPVCVENHIGFNMSKKTKYRVLAQLTPQERIESVTYLWQSPKDVQAMKKHYIKQKLLLHYDEERLALKNEYAPQLSVEGKKAVVASREYNKKLKDIERREEETILKLKEISKRTSKEMRLEGYAELDSKINLKNAKVKLKKGESLHIGPHKSNKAKKIVNELEKSVHKVSVEKEIFDKDINESIETFNKYKKDNKK